MRFSLLRTVLISAFCLATGLPTISQADSKIAFLVGVNKYERRGFINLDYAESDMEKLGAELKKLGFKVVLLKGSLPVENPLRATRKNIDAQLNTLLKESFITKDSIVLVAFSGHGEQLREKLPEGGFTDENYLCPVDAISGVGESQLSLSYLTDEILSKKGGKNLVLVDACRKVADKLKRKGIQGKISALPEDTAVLFSCRAGQESSETAILEQGLFTHCVLNGLRGEAAKEGIITWPRLVAHVQDQMASEPIQRILGGELQEPIQAGGVRRAVLGTLAVEKKFVGSKAGELWSENRLNMKFRWCPPGKFTMGSPPNEVGRGADETQVQVTLNQGFWMGQHEVTVGQFRQFIEATRYQTEAEKDGVGGKIFNEKDNKWESDSKINWRNPGFPQTDNHPVIQVSWNDATAFCLWLSEKEGRKFTLPSESQWEYACRSETTFATAFGGSLNSTQANFDGNFPYNDAAKGRYLAKTVAVGNYQPNGWSLHDLHGNVWEWCRDRYQEKLPGGTDPEILNSSNTRVLRGGGWVDDGRLCRSASRFKLAPDFRGGILGFRVAIQPN